MSAGALLRGLPGRWNTSADEAAASYPCDRVTAERSRAVIRAIDVDAPAPVLFRWICQLRTAPYSYDWIDQPGRRSPRTLTPGLDDVAVGQEFLVTEIVDFVPGEHITGRATPRAQRLFGVLAATYAVRPRGPAHSRLIVKVTLAEPRLWWQRARHVLLGWGDLIMMRKQLRTLKELAEGSHRTGVTASS